jgi:hypothetical protein
MPTSSQNQNTRVLAERIESQDQRLDDLAHRMDKYDEIIEHLQTIVIALKAHHENNSAWIRGILSALTIGATLIGAVIGAVATHLIH